VNTTVNHPLDPNSQIGSGAVVLPLFDGKEEELSRSELVPLRRLLDDPRGGLAEVLGRLAGPVQPLYVICKILRE
jgi:hypothetical protein